MKNIRPGRLALNLAAIISLAFVAVVIIIGLLVGKVVLWVYIAISALLIFALSYSTIYFDFKKYYYSQVQSIYDNVVKLRSSVRGKNYPPGGHENVIEEVNAILKEWEEENKTEVSQLKKHESFRREFLSNVSHELKTPIFTVEGYINTLLDGGIDDANINMLYLKKAAKSLDRLVTIVEDLESISKIEDGSISLDFQTFDITELAKEVIDSMELMATKRNIELRINPSTNKPFYVFADKDAIRQVFVNLISNSIKYGSEGGFTEVAFYEVSGLITTDVSDNGIGIKSEDHDRLFERFYRVDKSRSRDEGGTGLGLAIVKHIMEAHGQNISVRSEYKKGTSFSFTLKKS
ncbi:MAG: sensor histidine kinase [Bacteroidia bacterium]|nr:sensor histidine kinase [Bacteroidia bacterium]